MASPILAVTRKELVQTLRDRRMLPILFVAPLVQTAAFGFAVNLDLTAQPTVVADMDRSPESRDVVRTLEVSDGFDLVGVVAGDGEAEEMIWRGEAAVAVHVPRGYGADLERGEAEILVVLDGSDSNTALRAGQEISQILNFAASSRQIAKIETALASAGIDPGSALPRISVEQRAWFNPRLETAIFLVPGVLAMVLLVVTMVLTSMGLTREKEIGTLEQVMVSPLRPFELIVGKTVPFAMLGLLDVVLVSALAVVVFDVPVRGSIPALFAVSAVFLMTTLGLGLFVSTVSESQQQAMMNAFFIMLPALMLSGYVFPVEHMPEPAQWLAAINPLTYYIDLVRGLMVKGASLWDMHRSMASLTALGAGVLIASSLRFRKRAA